MPKVKTKRVIVCRQVYGKCCQLHLMEIIMLRKFIQFALRELNFNLLSARPFLKKSDFRLRKFYLCNAISGDWLNVNTK